MSKSEDGLVSGNRRALVEAVWRFDPAGVAQDRFLTPNEYDGLASAVGSLLEQGWDDASVVRWLSAELTENWGIEPLEEKLLSALKDMRESWTPR